jgi:hypothetical protein
MVRRFLLAFAVCAAFSVAGSSGASASCAEPPALSVQMSTAAVVFVGTVVYTSDGDRVAHVRVESIWKGPALATYVDVHGSPASGPFQASDVDRSYRTGVRYLFVLYSDVQPLQDNSCSATQPYTAELAALAPAGTRAPLPATALEEAQTFAIEHASIAGALAVLLAAGLVLVAIRWRRTKRV